MCMTKVLYIATNTKDETFPNLSASFSDGLSVRLELVRCVLVIGLSRCYEQIR